MKAFLSIKYHADHANRARIEMIADALRASGIESVCIARDVEQWGKARLDARELMARTFAEIEMCDLVIVDLTEKGVGVGIEAGYARAKNIPVLVIAQRGAEISETLRGIARAVFCYAGAEDLGRFVRGVLEDERRRTKDEG